MREATQADAARSARKTQQAEAQVRATLAAAESKLQVCVCF